MKHHKSITSTAMISHHSSLQLGPRLSICFGFLGILQLKSLAASIQTNQFLCQDPRRQRNIPISKIRHYTSSTFQFVQNWRKKIISNVIAPPTSRIVPPSSLILYRFILHRVSGLHQPSTVHSRLKKYHKSGVGSPNDRIGCIPFILCLATLLSPSLSPPLPPGTEVVAKYVSVSVVELQTNFREDTLRHYTNTNHPTYPSSHEFCVRDSGCQGPNFTSWVKVPFA